KLKNISQLTKTLSQQQEIKHFSKIIEEKVYLNYDNIGEIAYLRAVDSAYTLVNPIDEKVFFGKYPSFLYSNEAILEYSIDNRLAIPVGDSLAPAMLYMPKVGTGIISTEEDIFTKKEVFITGVFQESEELSNYIIAPLELGQELLNLPKNTAYKVVIKLKNQNDATKIKNLLTEKLGDSYIIKTKNEENAAFWKMINTEKLMIYLIFGLVIFITTFNLAGAVIILQLDKKNQAKSLISLGLSTSQLQNIYFYTGILIVIFGIISGLCIGTALCYIQLQTGVFKAGAEFPFPIQIKGYNYLIVSATALFFGGVISWIFSRNNKKYLS
ncbi:MAG: ABC transporter permease, partial [Bergeyella zoohelcum]|nr:ABC transporter permease [Bergeyella zoohelcum]